MWNKEPGHIEQRKKLEKIEKIKAVKEYLRKQMARKEAHQIHLTKDIH